MVNNPKIARDIQAAAAKKPLFQMLPERAAIACGHQTNRQILLSLSDTSGHDGAYSLFRCVMYIT